MKELPVFVPNDYLWEKHADKGQDRWEIYAWAIREIMCEVSGLEKNDQHYREKLHYENVILGYGKK